MVEVYLVTGKNVLILPLDLNRYTEKNFFIYCLMAKTHQFN